MTAYTVQIQASNAAGDIWQALHPSETYDPPATGGIIGVAQDVAANQNIATGDNWRVCVWRGKDADTGTEPDYILEPDGYETCRCNPEGLDHEVSCVLRARASRH